MRSGVWLGTVSFLSWVALIQPHADAAKPKPRPTLEQVKQLIEKKNGNVQIVSFPETGWSPIKVVRGGRAVTNAEAAAKPAERVETAEIVTFGDPKSSPVRPAISLPPGLPWPPVRSDSPCGTITTSAAPARSCVARRLR